MLPCLNEKNMVKQCGFKLLNRFVASFVGFVCFLDFIFILIVLLINRYVNMLIFLGFWEIFLRFSNKTCTSNQSEKIIIIAASNSQQRSK